MWVWVSRKVENGGIMNDLVTKWLSDQVTKWPSNRKLRRRLTGWYIYRWYPTPPISAVYCIHCYMSGLLGCGECSDSVGIMCYLCCIVPTAAHRLQSGSRVPISAALPGTDECASPRTSVSGRVVNEPSRSFKGLQSLSQLRIKNLWRH